MKPIENDETENLRVNLLTQEIKFAKMLAGNTFDSALKEKHIDKLSIWLKNRASCTEGNNKIHFTFIIYIHNCFPFSFHIRIYGQRLLANLEGTVLQHVDVR